MTTMLFALFWQVAVVAYVCQVRNVPLLCVLCFAPVKIGDAVMNMAEYGFSFRHKLSLCHLYHLQIPGLTTTFQHSSFT